MPHRYSHRSGRWQTTATGSKAFQGVHKELQAGRLEGTVTVREATGAEIRATFELSGSGQLAYGERVFRYRDGRLDGDQCAAEGGLCYDREGPVDISGDFSAPTAVEMKRPGRAIWFTYKAGSRR